MLQLTNPVAERAILVGDPGRALTLAQSLLTTPLMSNHQRGLWGYTGTAQDGRPLSIQSTGTGGPSTAAVLRELHDAGVRRAVRAGSALAVRPGLVVPGELRAVAFAIAADGTSRALGASDGQRTHPDDGLLQRLRETGTTATGLLSVDLLPQDGGRLGEIPRGVGGVDRQTASLFLAANRLGIPVAAVVAFPAHDEDESSRQSWWRAMGAVAAAALG